MKVYKKIMNGVAFVEKLILVLSTILIVVLTVGNVLSRKILHQSWSFTEELVVAVFVLITLLAAALAARDGELVNLSLLPDRLSAKARRILLVVNTVFSVAFTVVLFKYGMDKVLTHVPGSPGRNSALPVGYRPPATAGPGPPGKPSPDGAGRRCGSNRAK